MISIFDYGAGNLRSSGTSSINRSGGGVNRSNTSFNRPSGGAKATVTLPV